MLYGELQEKSGSYSESAAGRIVVTVNLLKDLVVGVNLLQDLVVTLN